MHLLKIIPVILVAPFVFSSCQKDTGASTSAPSGISMAGRLQEQGPTTYQYGTDVLIINSTNKIVLQSSTINLRPYEGDSVLITATLVPGPYVENGPALYDVTAISVR